MHFNNLIDLCIFFSFSKILAPQSYCDNSSLNKVYVCMYVSHIYLKSVPFEL